jgi:hypothetical protein
LRSANINGRLPSSSNARACPFTVMPIAIVTPMVAPCAAENPPTAAPE